MKLLAIFIMMLGMSAAHAGSDKSAKSENALWKEECGSCHLAYPPEMMSAENWQKLMGSLDKHFGANAVLNAKDNKLILDFLTHNSGSGSVYNSASLRISDTPWFKREHRSISAKEWVHPQVKSVSNCLACHGSGGHGLWSEHDMHKQDGEAHENHNHS